MRPSRFIILIHVLLFAVIAFGQASPDIPKGRDQTQTSDAATFPKYLVECEGDDCEAGSGLGRWIFDGKEGTGNWRNGQEAQLVIESFDGSNVIIRRTETEDSQMSGLTALYKGRLEGDRIDGTVMWDWPGHWDDETVPGTWYAVVRTVPFFSDPQKDFGCTPVDGHPEAIDAPLSAALYFMTQGGMDDAFCWIRTAAVRDVDLKSAGLLSVMYAGGLGVLEDDIRALRWARISAERGNPLPKEVLLALTAAAKSDPEQALEKMLAKGDAPFLLKVIAGRPITGSETVFSALLSEILKPGDKRYYFEGEWEAKCAFGDA